MNNTNTENTTYDVKKIKEDISSAIAEYKYAVARSSGITATKDRLKNILFNNKEAILGSFTEIDNIQKKLDATSLQVKNLSEALDESDDENAELRKKIKELEVASLKNAKGAAAKSSRVKKEETV